MTTRTISRLLALSLLSTGAVVAVPSAAQAAAPEPVRLLSASASYDEVYLDWINPFDINHDETVVCIGPGTAVPAFPGCTEIYRGFAPQAQVSELEPNQPYTFAVYTLDGEGTPSAAESVTVSAGKISLKVNRTRLTYGDDVTISGRVLDVVTGQGIAQGPVSIGGVDTRDEPFIFDTVIADGAGNFSYTWQPPESFQYFAVFGGDTGTLAGFSEQFVPVDVASFVLVDPVKKKVKLGKPVKLVVGAGPVDRGKKITVEQRIKGTWKKVATAKPNKEGVAVVKLKVKKKGTYSYRAYRAAAAGASSGTSKKVKVKVV